MNYIAIFLLSLLIGSSYTGICYNACYETCQKKGIKASLCYKSCSFLCKNDKETAEEPKIALPPLGSCFSDCEIRCGNCGISIAALVNHYCEMDCVNRCVKGNTECP